MEIINELLSSMGLERKYSDQYKDLFIDIKIKGKIDYPTPVQRYKFSEIVFTTVRRFFDNDPILIQHYYDQSKKYWDSLIVCAYNKDIKRFRSFIDSQPEIKAALADQNNEDACLIKSIKALLTYGFQTNGIQIEFNTVLLVNDMPSSTKLLTQWISQRFKK